MKNFFYTKKNNKYSSGFTLVELMVSLMIFLIVVLAAVGSLYTVNSASKKVQAMKAVLDNLSFSVESMSRTIRTGTDYVCGGSINSGNPDCSFANQNPSSTIMVSSTLGVESRVEYRLGSNPDGTGALQKRVEEGGLWTNWISITSPEIDIDKLDFFVEGADPLDSISPTVSLFIKGVASTEGDTAPFSIQTLISQRAAE